MKVSCRKGLTVGDCVYSGQIHHERMGDFTLTQYFSSKNYCNWFCGINRYLKKVGLQLLSSNKHITLYIMDD